MGTLLAHFLGMKQSHHAHLFMAVRVGLSLASQPRFRYVTVGPGDS